jgi:pimeloyl-ACP methyl ester carboxylesterase
MHPVVEYDTAMEKIAHIQAFEKRLKLYEGCNTTVLTHGHKVEQVIILVHGLTSCPLQFVEFGTLLFEQGYNVLIPRLTYNGYANRETTDLQYLTVNQMHDNSAIMVDIAHGLGEHITYAGISAGGTMAAWVAQYCPNVDRAILIAPAFTIDRRLNATASRLVMYLLYLLPNIMTQSFRRTHGSKFGYPGFASRALATMMRLGFLVYDAALRTKPAVQSILTITNAADPSMNNAIIRNLLTRWKKHGLRYCEQYEFEASHNLPHDIIGVQQPKQNVAYVYPILLDLITKNNI